MPFSSLLLVAAGLHGSAFASVLPVIDLTATGQDVSTGTTFSSRSPSTDYYELNIVNGDINPDGFTRQAVLADGVFPGPLISGNKVIFKHSSLRDETH